MSIAVRTEWQVHLDLASTRKRGTAAVVRSYFGDGFQIATDVEHPTREGLRLVLGELIVNVSCPEELIGHLMRTLPQLPQPWVVRQEVQQGVCARIVGGPTCGDAGGPLRYASFDATPL